MMTARQVRVRETLQGLRAGAPVAIGYLPAAFAFGAAAATLGIAPLETASLSLVMYSGATQAFLLSAMATGLPVLLIVLVGIAVSLRHALYGLALRRRIAGGRVAQLVFGYGLTDEVFATAMNATGQRAVLSGPWLVGLAFAAWASWVSGTILGALAGDALRAADPRVAEALEFALPALFLGLVWVSVRRTVLGPMALAGALSGASILIGVPELAIPSGAVAAFAAGRSA